mmetsp:Transcript_41985/g.94344  ORF Transcript_41985/g.94344 Transcript_41985/m.94344 type:complete len:221 (+) Transcript_41985:88-750(+)
MPAKLLNQTSKSTWLLEPVPLDVRLVEVVEAANALAVALASTGPALITVAEGVLPPPPPPAAAALLTVVLAPLESRLDTMPAVGSASGSDRGDPPIPPVSCEESCNRPSRPSIRANHVKKGAAPSSCMCGSPAPNGHSSSQIAQPTILHAIATMPNGRPTISVEKPIQTTTPRSEQPQQSRKGLNTESTSKNTTYPKMATSTIGKLMALQRYISTLLAAA